MMNKELFFNREFSWIEFNYRVLEEALDRNTPLMERLKFLSIFSNNLDEFFMVRIAGLMSQIQSGYSAKDSSGYTPIEIVEGLEARIKELVKMQYDCYNREIKGQLEKEGLVIYTKETLPEQYMEELSELFLKKYFLILTPMAIDQARPFPFLTGKGLNLLISLKNPNSNEELFAIIPIPSKNRFIPINGAGDNSYIYIEEMIKLFGHHFFKGYEIVNSCTFRVTRDAELSLDEEYAIDLLSAIEDELKKRKKGTPIRLEVESTADESLINFLHSKINFYKGFDFYIDGPIDFSSFTELVFRKGFDKIKDPPYPPIIPLEFRDKKRSIFDIITEKDIMLHHPYVSFDPVVRFIEEASVDPNVLAIKQTLYRTSGDSPIIKALKKAAESGKQVTVLVELKARFDEEQNINWAKQLEKAGCHVVYGLVGLKTHCKIALVVRDEEDGIRRYVHLSTGNYNDKTARIYTDTGLFSVRKSFGRDGSAIFNLLTGYSEPPRWKKLVTAPLDMRNFFLERIEIEKKNALEGGKGKIIAKMNALIDIKIIKALYEASQAGVKIDLIVRGMCRLKPGVKKLSENIRVISVVDRFLEHSRIYYFYNNGNDDIFMASADWMERNFDKRIELLFPIESSSIKEEIKDIFQIIFKDNQKMRVLHKDGNYKRVKPQGGKLYNSQTETYRYYQKRNSQKELSKRELFIPRKNPDEKI